MLFPTCRKKWFALCRFAFGFSGPPCFSICCHVLNYPPINQHGQRENTIEVLFGNQIWYWRIHHYQMISDAFFRSKGIPESRFIYIYIGYPSHVNDRDHEITGSINCSGLSWTRSPQSSTSRILLGIPSRKNHWFNTKLWSYDIL